jgi:PAS domain S-box-containing protein
MLQALVSGIINYPYFCRAVIEDARGVLAQSGETRPGSTEKSFPLYRKAKAGGDFYLGTLRIEIDTRKIFDEVLRQTLTTVALLVLLFVLESFFVLLFFSRTATRHLSRIAAYIIKNDIQPDAPPLALDKKYRGDEIDFLVKAYNRMREDIAASREAERRAMEELRLSEERSRILVEEAPDAIMMYDADERVFMDCNRRAEEVFGRSRAELIGTNPVDLYVGESDGERSIQESVLDATNRALAGETVLIRRRVLRPGGDIVDCDVRLNQIPAPGRRIIRASYLDVTERVRAEEALVRSLREKEILIQEVYHRTKNNMQLITSFLGLEAEASRDEHVASALQDMIGRISSMALVHQKLYKSEDLSRIDLGEYVRDLVYSIKNACLEGRRGIDVAVETEPGVVAVIDLAVPCGLVLNELVTNCAKYAFNGRESGRISVVLKRRALHELELCVSDDGVGLPEGFDYRRDGHIGMQTVVSIVELQLHGSVSIASGSTGTTCTALMRDDMFGPRL